MDLSVHAKNIRKNIIKSGYRGGYAHFGGSLSAADILAVLFGYKMNFDANNPEKKERDRFILSKGHCALLLYATLHEFNFISEEQLMSFNSNGGDFPSHCVMNTKFGIELSSGSLGMGLSFGIGKAIALKDISQIYVLIGNGEINEGSFWESAMFAGCKKIGNLCIIIDNNEMQLDGISSKIMPINNIKQRLDDFYWKTVEIDGCNIEAIKKAFDTERDGRPLAILADTIKGKGVSFMEKAPEWHHNHLSDEQYEIALKEIEALS